MTGDVVGDGRLDDQKGRKSATIQALSNSNAPSLAS